MKEWLSQTFYKLVLFLIILYTALRFLVRFSLKYQGHKLRFLIWCIFVAVAGNCISFLGVPFFGQMTMLWYLVLACVSFLVELNKAEDKIMEGIKHRITITKTLPIRRDDQFAL